MMTSVNTHKPTNRTLAVINGGLNVEAGVQKVSMPPKPKLLDKSARRFACVTTVQSKDRGQLVHWVKRFIFFTISVIPQKWRNRR